MTYLFLGRRRRGKTTLAYYMAAKIRRRVILDPRGMIRRPGAVVVRTAEDFESAMDALADGDISEVVYTPIDSIRGAAWPAFTREMKNWIVTRPQEPIAFLVDELSFVCRKNQPLDEDFDWSLKTCDTAHIHFFLTCHRPADVPVDVRAIGDHWCVFHVTQEHDLDVIRERCQAPAVAVVGELRGSEFLMWDDGTGTYREFRIPDDWYIPLREGHSIEWEALNT